MSNSRQKLSGAEYRKRAKEKAEHQREIVSSMRSLTNWLQQPSTSAVEDNNTETHVSAGESQDYIHRESEGNNMIQDCYSEDENIVTPSTTSTLMKTHCPEDSKGLDESMHFEIDSVDPAFWPAANVMSENVRSSLCSSISKKTESYPGCIDFTLTKRNDRCLTPGTWYKLLPNGCKIFRKWLVYSKSKNALFCASCKLFDNTITETNLSALASTGFYNWKKNSEKLSQHESSIQHMRCMTKFITLANTLRNCSGIDRELEKSIQTEKDRWRIILRIIFDVILYLATNCLSFRGSTENTSSLLKMTPSPSNGNFLNLVVLLAKHNTVLKEKLESLKKGQVSYLSKTTQNEIIGIMSQKVRQEIITEITAAKYYTVMFDCTPDASHSEQMSHVIRYVKINESGECKVFERFIDFIEVHEKTGEYMTNIIIKKLEDDGLSISDCRGQSYDNASNMSGTYRGVQARIKDMNKYAVFVPCIAHSLNLVGVHASSACPEAERLFGVVQRIYNFFVSSTLRWDVMKKHTKSNVKGSSQTRWSAKADAVSALKLNLNKVVDALNELRDGDYSPETKSEAVSLVNEVLNFEFILYLVIWNDILREINRVNKEIQKNDIVLARSIHLMEGLSDTLKRFRCTGFDEWLKDATTIAESMSVDTNIKERRVPKRKRMPGELADDELRTLSQSQRIRQPTNIILDRTLTEINHRLESVRELNLDFAFLTGAEIIKMSLNDLKQNALNLAHKYDMDLNSTEFISELRVFQEQGKHLHSNINELQPVSLLEVICKNDLQDAFPNLSTALKIYATLPTTSASCERSFSKMKLIKNYLRSTMCQERLSGLAVLSIESEIANKLNYDIVIDDFAEVKARKINL